jgi:hypothetical protein
VNSSDGGGASTPRSGESGASAERTLPEATSETPPAEARARENQEAGLGRRGWLLVGVVVLSTLVVPGVIYLRPASAGATGLPFLASMLALPMVPALLLGATALWSVAAGAGDEER